jgi:hypothetical protein
MPTKTWKSPSWTTSGPPESPCEAPKWQLYKACYGYGIKLSATGQSYMVHVIFHPLCEWGYVNVSHTEHQKVVRVYFQQLWYSCTSGKLKHIHMGCFFSVGLPTQYIVCNGWESKLASPVVANLSIEYCCEWINSWIKSTLSMTTFCGFQWASIWLIMQYTARNKFTYYMSNAIQ